MILGVWDGHDSGAAAVEDGKIISAVNEERFTRRKLEVRFPERSVEYLMAEFGADEIAVPTYDLQKTLSRILPGLKEAYYKFRRRKMKKPFFEFFMRAYKYWATTLKGNFISMKLSESVLKKRFKKVRMIDHHIAHAYSALQSGFRKCLVITLDGVGDGKSGMIAVWNRNGLEVLKTIPAKHSLGIFFEQATVLLGFRELEDEGKVTALAAYAHPKPWKENPFRNFFSVNGLEVRAQYHPVRQFHELSRIIWSLPREDAAFFAQQALERWATELVSNAIEETGIREVSLAGGVFANIKVNMRIRELAERVFVFPHMGDGGLAAGAALALEGKQGKLEHAYLGPEFEPDRSVFEGLEVEETDEPEKVAAHSLLDGEIVFWFQGRMEYGPRALGNRSILARPDVEEIRDTLNLRVKRRQWYQPFCPSVLEEDMPLLFENPYKEKFMTMAFRIKPGAEEYLKAVMAPDRTTRPQAVGRENPLYRSLLKEVKKELGIGAVLNTSFNIHGEPIVMTPEDAVRTFKATGTGILVVGNYVARNP